MGLIVRLINVMFLLHEACAFYMSVIKLQINVYNAVMITCIQ